MLKPTKYLPKDNERDDKFFEYLRDTPNPEVTITKKAHQLLKQIQSQEYSPNQTFIDLGGSLMLLGVCSIYVTMANFQWNKKFLGLPILTIAFFAGGYALTEKAYQMGLVNPSVALGKELIRKYRSIIEGELADDMINNVKAHVSAGLKKYGLSDKLHSTIVKFGFEKPNENNFIKELTNAILVQ